MGRLGAYKIDLKGQEDAVAAYQWLVDSDFFAALDVEDIHNGHVAVDLSVTKVSGEYDLSFRMKGDVSVPCDRCLDDMSIDIDTGGELKVRLGADFADDGDVVVVPELEGTINVSWYIYEFISLAVPLKHVHAPGKCNREMSEQLEKHIVSDVENSEVDGQVDSRWAELEKLNFEEELNND